MNKEHELKFGTSGLRGLVSEMTDREVYLNTLGFLSFLEDTEDSEKEHAILLAGDLRASTEKIMSAVSLAVKDKGWRTLCAGKLPSPALALYALSKGIAGIMVTGSHIPEDRNGIKFTKTTGEILKEDEPIIVKHVEEAREALKNASGTSLFSPEGTFNSPAPLPAFACEEQAVNFYVKRYREFFPSLPLHGITLVHYEQSAVGRDILTAILEKLGARVIRTGRCKGFLPVDTEKISDSTREVFREAAGKHSPFAILSTDGDSDRPLLADENGDIIPGDKLGGLAALYLKPDFAALPITTNEAVVRRLERENVHINMTKIGSPYVIKAMEEQAGGGTFTKIAGWEANGGFLTATDWKMGKYTLGALCTRDAVLPILSALLLAKESDRPLSRLLEESFEKIYSVADVVDNNTAGMESYTAEKGRQIIEHLSPPKKQVKQINFENGVCTILREHQNPRPLSEEKMLPFVELKQRITKYFSLSEGFAEILSINFIDGIRVAFNNSETVHLRPSGNAPEFRMYAFAPTPGRAEEILKKRFTIIPKILYDLKGYAS